MYSLANISLDIIAGQGTTYILKRKTSLQLGNNQLRAKKAKRLAALLLPITSKKAKSPIMSIGPSSFFLQKISLNLQKIKRPPIDSFWQTYSSNKAIDYLQLSKDIEAYAIRVHYFHSWLDIFVQGLLVDEIAAAFAATILSSMRELNHGQKKIYKAILKRHIIGFTIS